ncbi:MAG TPA: DUF881 domain-containing protein [Candidatus Limnocylindria bacterium]|nr:DUF881 domain-containing protein [Candidatus Limnocylindria bacterium]
MSRRLPPKRRFVRPQWAISIGVALAAIGFVGAAQWNSSLARQEFVTSAQRVLISEAQDLQREQDDLRAQIEEAEDRVRSFQTTSAGSQAQLDQINSDLAEARLESGLLAVHGPGVVIEIADSTRQVPPGESVNNYLVLADDLRDIVTALWASGAEAITISGERLVSTTSIYSAGSAILVNTVPLVPPYRIEAIGPDGLHDRFLSNQAFLGRVGQRIDAYGLQFATEARDDLQLPAFVGNTRMRWGAPETGAE